MMTALSPNFSRSVQAVAVGASAGGIEALFQLFRGLHTPFRASIVVVLHLPDDHASKLPEVFSKRLGIAVEEAQPHAPLAPGTLYFAPPGYHLLVEADRTFSLSCDAPVLFSRPSIDVLLESCAHTYGSGMAGLVLTGANQDGAVGLALVKAAGGLTAVQDPAEASHTSMPLAAIAAADPHYVMPLAGLHGLLHTVIR